MEMSAFEYELPEERIAQEPTARREDARLMLLRREGGEPEDHLVADLPELLRRGDLLALNDSRVLPVRLHGNKQSGGAVELLLLRRLQSSDGRETWSALARASKPLRPGAGLTFPGGMHARVQAGGEEPIIELRPPADGSVEAYLGDWGLPPLPPYIRREPLDARGALDRKRYQTVFARAPGSAAAPTAGLHFSQDLLARLLQCGIGTASCTLHVGRGTFQPIRVDSLEAHRMHSEWCRLSTEAAASMLAARRANGRVVAVGTTVVRTLEARWGEDGPLPGEGDVDLFLQPGHRFRAIDGLLTNFHLPRSSLLVLVAAFAGRERVLAAYRTAVQRGYRFYSYGDAMLVL
jgi:S-adenosylmethionine:tRNA ribosyltransferase-isomerase